MKTPPQKERFKPRRRELKPKRRDTAERCVVCKHYTTIEGGPCLWKLEAQIDAASQHLNIALSLMRKITAKQRRLIR